jgi:hypothetical protein
MKGENPITVGSFVEAYERAVRQAATFLLSECLFHLIEALSSKNCFIIPESFRRILATHVLSEPLTDFDNESRKRLSVQGRALFERRAHDFLVVFLREISSEAAKEDKVWTNESEKICKNFEENVVPILIQSPVDSSGLMRCNRWTGAFIPREAMISIVPTDPSGEALSYAQQLATGIKWALLAMSPQTQPIQCTGLVPKYCCGHKREASRRVLVLVGDGRAHNDYTGAIALWESKRPYDERYRVIPICPPAVRAGMAAALPESLQDLNVFEWTANPAEMVPAVLGAANLIPNDFRVFISYRREDGDQYADDLFAELSSRGFDVFLDRVNIRAGASFPERIREEIAHKSVLLVLETPRVDQSVWVAREVAIAAANRLAILAIHFPNGTKIASLSSRRRFSLEPTDINTPGYLTKDARERICRHIEDLHSRWLLRRSYQMQRTLSNALLDRELTNQRFTPFGRLDVVPAWSPKTVCSIRITPQFAGLEDFRTLDMSPPPPCVWQKAIITPGALIPGERQASMGWLSNRLDIPRLDESEIPYISHELADPTLSRLLMSPRSKLTLKDKIVLFLGGQLSQSDRAESESKNYEIQSNDEADVRIEEAIIALARAVFSRGGRLAFRHDPMVTPLVIEVALEYWQSLPADPPILLIFAAEPELAKLRADVSRIGCAELRQDNKLGELSAHRILYVGGIQGPITEFAAQNLARPASVFSIPSTGGAAQAVVAQEAALDRETEIIETIYKLQRAMHYSPPNEEEMFDPKSRDGTLPPQEGQIPNFRYALYPLVMKSILKSES